MSPVIKKPNKEKLCIVLLCSMAICVLLLFIQIMSLSKSINETRNYVLDELEVIDARMDLTDIEKEIDKLEERIIDLENGE